MSFTHPPGKGTLFVNDSANPKAPNLSGQITAPDGTVWELALWTATDRETGEARKDKSGFKFFSVSVNEPRAEKPKAQTSDEDIPF